MKLPFEFRKSSPALGALGSRTSALKLLFLRRFAARLYASFHSAQDAQRTLPIDVVAVDAPENAHGCCSRRCLRACACRRGRRTILDEMKADDLGSFQLDLRSARSTRRLRSFAGHLPPGAREQMDPPFASPGWEDQIIPRSVQASITGQPAPGSW